jgi:hypothetical protein
MDSITQFINTANEMLLCNSDCQKQKKAEQLKQEYLKAKTNLITAPNQIYTTQKNYIEFTEGTQAYNELIEQELNEKAEIISQKYKIYVNDEIKKLHSLINVENITSINFKNSFELITKYVKENKELLNELKQNSSDVLTNERKTYYQDQGISKLNSFYKYFFLTIYIICVFCFGMATLMYPSNNSWYYKLGVFLGLIILE